jgi:hypothetical protein
MGLYQYIREQKHRNDLVGELGNSMSKNYNQRPDHSSLAFQLASKEFSANGHLTKKDAIQRLNENENLQKIIKIEPRVGEIISEAIKLESYQGYNRDEEYSRLKSRIIKLVGYGSEKDEVRDSDSYEVVIQTIVKLLPPDMVDLYPDGSPDEIFIDL